MKNSPFQTSDRDKNVRVIAMPVLKVSNPYLRLDFTSAQELSPSGAGSEKKGIHCSSRLQEFSNHPTRVYRTNRQTPTRTLSSLFIRYSLDNKYFEDYPAKPAFCCCLSSPSRPLFLFRIQNSLSILTCSTSSHLNFWYTKLKDQSGNKSRNLLAVRPVQLSHEEWTVTLGLQSTQEWCSIWPSCSLRPTRRTIHTSPTKPHWKPCASRPPYSPIEDFKAANLRHVLIFHAMSGK